MSGRLKSFIYYSQIHMVPKPEKGDWRTCMDFRNLNKASTPGKGVIPNLQEMFSRIGQKHTNIFKI